MKISEKLGFFVITLAVVSCSDKKTDVDSSTIVESSWHDHVESRLSTQDPVHAESVDEVVEPVSVIGVSSKKGADYGKHASSSDLVNLGSSALESVSFSKKPFRGRDSHNNGTVGDLKNIEDITFWKNASAGDTYAITYILNTNTNTLGYDIQTIQTIHGWHSNSGLQKNQNYVVEVSTVGSTSFTKVATVVFEPFTNAITSGSSKVNLSRDTGVIASEVDQIRFTYTVQSESSSQPGPTIREIDVFGTATAQGF